MTTAKQPNDTTRYPFAGFPRFETADPMPFVAVETGQWVRWDDMLELIRNCLDVGSGSQVMQKIADAFSDTLGVKVSPSDI